MRNSLSVIESVKLNHMPVSASRSVLMWMVAMLLCMDPDKQGITRFIEYVKAYYLQHFIYEATQNRGLCNQAFEILQRF